MRIYSLLTHRAPDIPSPIVLGAQRLLGKMGYEVTRWTPEGHLLRTSVLTPEAGLYVLESRTELALSYAGALHGQGAAVCDEYGACLAAQDKVIARRLIRELRMSAPGTWLIGSPQQAIGLLAEEPLTIKPHRGCRGAGLYLIGEAARLTSMQTSSGPLIAQRYVPDPGEDLEVYVAGENVWAVRKPFDSQSFTRSGHSAHVDEEIKDTAARIRSGFGLELFRYDVIEPPDGPRVVGVNHFPGYKGCLDPALVIAATTGRMTRGS